METCVAAVVGAQHGGGSAQKPGGAITTLLMGLLF
jgi:hypothetical protein